jgi:hypothetical protein
MSNPGCVCLDPNVRKGYWSLTFHGNKAGKESVRWGR